MVYGNTVATELEAVAIAIGIGHAGGEGPVVVGDAIFNQNGTDRAGVRFGE